jgi:flagellar operon protein
VITTIDRIAPVPGTVPATREIGPSRPHSGLGTFAQELSAAAEDRELHLSSHALRRLEQRGIEIGPTQLDRLSSAFDQLAGKGGRQSVVMLDQVAYVVNVPSKTVVTAVGPNDDHSSVFTKIDSVVIA